jgi:ABC-type sugar transport system ATPase subunit
VGAATAVQRPVLAVEGLSKTYAATRVLSDVGLSVGRRDIHALVGGNGSGKSTLIKVLAGVVAPDPGGTICVEGRSVAAGKWTPHDARAAHLRFVHQDLGLFADLSVVDNLCIGAGYPTSTVGRVRWHSATDAARALLGRHGLDVDPRTALGDLSLAEQSMVAIARALQDVDAGAAACVVLDEPTAALPAHDADRLLRVLRALADAGHGVILVTHHIDEVLSSSDRVTVLRDGRRVHNGPTRELDRGKLIDLIVGSAGLRAGAVAQRKMTGPGAPLLRTVDVRSGRAESISLTIHRGEIVGLAGLLASGCEDIPRTLFGLLPRAGGEVWIDGTSHALRSPAEAMRAGIAFLPGDRLRDGLFRELTVLENATAASTSAAGRWRIHHRRERRAAQALIERYQVRPPHLRRRIQTLSGGNQQKVLLARWASRRPRLLLLEEPTRGVDVGARTEIWDLLRERVREEGLSILVTSSDIEELAWYCDRILVMGDGRVHSELSGDALDPSRITNAIFEASTPVTA